MSKVPIKLSLSIKYENNASSGKHKFANRLVKEIIEKYPTRIAITDRSLPSDVYLSFDGKLRSGVKNIYRIDGVWMNVLEGDLKSKNQNLVDGLTQADAVIFQSEFCEQAVNKFLNIYPSKKTVIYNGADPTEFVREDKQPPSRPTFITMCKWRPHKRFKEIALGFLNSKVHTKSVLHVFGNVDAPIFDSNIIYHGWSKKVNTILPWCIASVHISYLDWCPNAVIESLVAGVPVIYADSGGTPYLVKQDGFAIKDTKWNFKPINLYKNKSHPIAIADVSRAYEEAFAAWPRKHKIVRKDLYISSIARQYVDYIEKIA